MFDSHHSSLENKYTKRFNELRELFSQGKIMSDIYTKQAKDAFKMACYHGDKSRNGKSYRRLY